jgi:hypothetical protein
MEIINKLHEDMLEAQDNLTRAKISQSAQANKSCTLTFPFKAGDRVRLSTKHRRHEFKATGQRRVAKFMPQFDSPFLIIAIDENNSTVTLDLPPTSKRHPIFHTSQLLPFVENDSSLFPSCEFSRPPPIIDEDGNEEFLVQDIIDERPSGRGTV